MFDERRRGGFFRNFLITLVTSLGVGVLVFFLATNYTGRNPAPPRENPQVQDPQTAPLPQQIAAEVTGAQPIAAAVARSATPGVVGISVLKVDGKSLFDRDTSGKWGVGSGVVVSKNGYILTNHHVAGGKSKRIIVSFSGGKNVDGITQWSDPVLDLAVVKVNLDNLVTIPLGDSNAVQVGEQAIAIGNPLGLQFQRTVTSGIISALNRTIRIDTEQGANYMEDLIQTDASINPGNSGGPLLNARGQAIGINTIKVTSAEAIGFAIPINVTKPIISRFVSDGSFSEPYIGVFAYDREVIPYLDSSIRLDKGIYVANVDNTGPAARNGIKVGCIITQVDGKDINTMMQLRTYIYSKKPGEMITVTHMDEGKTMTSNIRLAAKEKDGLITR
jgi:serine protease Do